MFSYSISVSLRRMVECYLMRFKVVYIYIIQSCPRTGDKLQLMRTLQ